VLLRFRKDASDQAKRALREGLAGLPAQIPELRRYQVGDDLGLAQGNFDFAIVAEVDDQAAFRVYVDHPAHQEVVTQCIRPILEERVAVQFLVD
jgi:hypothetical protein